MASQSHPVDLSRRHFTGSDCAVDKKKMYAHPMGKGKSPCEVCVRVGMCACAEFIALFQHLIVLD